MTTGPFFRDGELLTHSFTLYAPYVAIPHIRIISREMAEAMHMSEAEREVKGHSGYKSQL